MQPTRGKRDPCAIGDHADVEVSPFICETRVRIRWVTIAWNYEDDNAASPQRSESVKKYYAILHVQVIGYIITESFMRIITNENNISLGAPYVRSSYVFLTHSRLIESTKSERE